MKLKQVIIHNATNTRYSSAKWEQQSNHKRTEREASMKNILVEFDMQLGEQEHIAYYLFNKPKSEYQYCKHYWGLKKKNELKKDVFWDNNVENAIKVHSIQKITNEQAKTLKELGIVY